MDKEYKLPFYLKVSVILIGLFVFVWSLSITQTIVIPLVFSLILAILLHPVVIFFHKRGVNRVISIIITLVLAFLVISALAIFIISQVSMFSESWPKLVDRMGELLHKITLWASGSFDVSPKKVQTWIDDGKNQLINVPAISKTLLTVGSSLFLLILIPVYLFMLLYYEPLLMEFLYKLSGRENHSQMKDITNQVKNLIQRYLTGLIIEASLVATLESTALFILGIQYALLLGVLGGLLNMIPYIGAIISATLPMLMALLTKDSPWAPLYVMGAFYFIQLVDNNYIQPKIVASRVKINALISIVSVVSFGVLWGIPGMFLSIPLVAITKLVFDHIDSLKPWGFLLGDEMPDTGLLHFKIRKKKIVH